jgi:hypothetical protein
MKTLGKKGLEVFIELPVGNGTYYHENITIKQASPVRWIYEDVPQWFIDTIRKVSPDSDLWDIGLPGGDGESSVMIFHEVFGQFPGWLDHAGWSKEWGKTLLVSEPYALDAKSLAELMHFVNTCGLNMKIFGHSYHYPSETIRIETWPK